MNKITYKDLKKYISENRMERIDKILESRTRDICVLLENIYQPHNFNAVLRTCDNLGIQDIYCINSEKNTKTAKSVSLGAEKWITIKEKAKGETVENFLKKIKKKGYELVGTSPHIHRKTESITKFKAPKKFVIAFGNEEKGLSNQLIKHCDKFINIPMYGFSESYNISVTCAITLSLISIKLREKKKISPLSNKDKGLLKLEWYKKSIKNSNLIIKRLEKE